MGIRILTICGLPSCGKTTVGMRLATELRVDFLRESAECLIDAGYSPGAHASEDFDRKILELELSRDSNLLSSERNCIVETWHIGNYSYCLARNSPVANRYGRILTSASKAFDIGCLFLRISPQISAYRCREKSWPGRGDIKKAGFHTFEFLEKLDLCFRQVLKEFPIRTFVIDSSKPITEVLLEAKTSAARFFRPLEPQLFVPH